MNHAYPRDLALAVIEHWGGADDPAGGLPDPETLEEILSVCYQASLLRDENRPLKFRVRLCAPELFDSEDGPPSAPQRFLFTRTRPLDPHEIRRLSYAAAFDRALIGVSVDPERGARIWGLVHTGVRWLYETIGGRASPPELPPCLCVCASAPGRLEIYKGSKSIGMIDGGRISCPVINAFESRWLTMRFADIRAEVIERHHAARKAAGGSWARIDEMVVGLVNRHAVKRLVSVIRNSRHGGTLVILPPDAIGNVLDEGRYIFPKYRVVQERSRGRFLRINSEILNCLAEEYGKDGGPERVVSIREYLSCRAPRLQTLDEAIVELSNLVAALAAVDGCVIMSKRFEIIGFGGEISGDLPGVLKVARAIDVEAREVAMESTESVGTRHRSAYRICNALHDAMCIVVSQDGEVRFVNWKDGAVTYWEHQATGS